MFFLAAVLLSTQLDTDRDFRARLERTVQTLPIHGQKFRSEVAKVAAEFRKDQVAFAHPVGEMDSTLVSFGRTNPIFVVFRDHGRLHVEPILTPKDYDEEGPGPYQVIQAAWSKGRLFTLLRWRGGTGNNDYGRVFSLQNGQWRMVQHLDTGGENAWEGERTCLGVLTQKPLTVVDTFEIRKQVDEHRSHSGVCLNFRESWRFHDGILTRTALKRIETPYAALCDVFDAIELRQRSRFDRYLKPKLRDQVWRRLLNGHHFADNESSDVRDETPHLVIDHTIGVTLCRQNGHWILNEIKTEPASK